MFLGGRMHHPLLRRMKAGSTLRLTRLKLSRHPRPLRLPPPL
ncbi:MAG: hypothetical protein QXI27_05400 [Nitrososphaerota archaeon]